MLADDKHNKGDGRDHRLFIFHPGVATLCYFLLKTVYVL